MPSATALSRKRRVLPDSPRSLARRGASMYAEPFLADLPTSLNREASLLVLYARGACGDSAMRACSVLANGVAGVRERVSALPEEAARATGRHEGCTAIVLAADADRVSATLMARVVRLTAECYQLMSDLHGFVDECSDELGGYENPYIDSVLTLLSMGASDLRGAARLLSRAADMLEEGTAMRL